MALHPDITRKDDVSLALETAAGAMLLASRQQTSNAGSVTIPNADGTKTVIGVDAGDTTVAKWVGDTIAPGKPTGLSWDSHLGATTVTWDGTLDGGVPADFAHVAFTGKYGDTTTDMGVLTKAGTVLIAGLADGTQLTVTAVAWDDAHDDNGYPTPNGSAPVTLTITVADESVRMGAEAKEAGDKADAAIAANTQLRNDTESSLATVTDTVAGVRTDVDKASADAKKAQSGVDAANTKITTTSDKVDGLTTTVSNVSKNADDAMALSTQNHQDLTGFQQTVSNTYSTKDETLSQVAAVSTKADSISATLSKDYQKTTDADAKYATQSSLSATANSINASVAETYATKSVVDALQNIADNAIETWQGHGVPSMTGEPTSGWTTGDLKKQHSGDMYYDLDTGYSYRFGSADGSTYTWDKIADSDITKALQAAAAAQSSADTANAGVSKLNTDIPATYATKSDVKITTDGIKTDVSKAMSLGQKGIDDASAVDQKANGIQATVSQQTKDIAGNVKAIAQVNLRADSLSTSITQVSDKTDLALANAEEKLKNPTFVNGFDGWTSQWRMTTTPQPDHWGVSRLLPVCDQFGGGYGNKFMQGSTAVPVNPGQVWQLQTWAKVLTEQSGKTLLLQLKWYDASGNQHWMWMKSLDASAKTDWTLLSGTVAIPSTAVSATLWLHVSVQAGDAVQVLVDSCSLKDVTEAASAQKAADDAQSTANTAVSQNTTLTQDLNGFKTSVGQTYETKTDSMAKSTALQQNLDGFKTSVSSTYATKQALGDTDGKAVKAGNNATLALANAQNMIMNTGNDLNNTWNNNGVTAENGVYKRTFPGKENHVDFFWGGLSGKAIPGHTYSISFDARVVSGNYVSNDSFVFGWSAGWFNVSANHLSSDWQQFSSKTTVGGNGSDNPSFYMSSYMNSDGTKVVQFRNLSIKDITEVAQLQSDVAATYATQSSVQQTSSQITQQVAATYATKDDVASRYTTLQQTDNAFDARIGTAQSTAATAQSNASNAQNRAGVLETLIHSDANGVRVGKTVNGVYTGYSALVNSNGSFDVLNPAGQMVSRFNSDGIQMPSGLVSVNGIPMVEDITDELVFMNTYWQYWVSATRIFNQVIMQVWCKRHGDPAGDYVPPTWGSSQLFKIKRGYRPYGVPGNTNGQDIHFPMANNAVTSDGYVSPSVYMQVTDTFIAIRSPFGTVRFKNDVTWLSGVVSWVIDPDHQTSNDDSASQN